MRLYAETECEHGNWNSCDHIPMATHLITRNSRCLRLDCNEDHDSPCPGGSRREITVDYEAAVKAASEEFGGSLAVAFGFLLEDDHPVFIDSARAIVDAAIGGGVDL